MKQYLTAFILLVTINAHAQYSFQKTLESDGTLHITNAAATGDHGYILTGDYKAPGGDYNGVLVKVDSFGTFKWGKQYSSYGDDYPNYVYEEKDSGYIVIGTTWSGANGIWFMKTDTGGAVRYVKNLNAGTLGSQDRCYSVIASSDGGFLVIGAAIGAVPPSSSYDITYLLKIDRNGNVQWAERFDNGGPEAVFNGVETADHNFVIVGTTSGFGVAKTSVLVMEVTSEGDVSAKTYTLPVNSFGYFIYERSDGSFIVSGMDRTYVTFLMALNSDFSVDWIKSLEGMTDTRDMILTADQGCLLVADGYDGIKLVKMDADGNNQWCKDLYPSTIQYPIIGFTVGTIVEQSDYQTCEVFTPTVIGSNTKLLMSRTSGLSSGVSGCETFSAITPTVIDTPTVSSHTVFPLFPGMQILSLSPSTVDLTLPETDLCIMTNLHENVSQSRIEIFPQPSAGIFTIVNREEKIARVDIYNNLGQNIYSGKVNPGKTEIDLHQQESGIYFIRLEQKDGPVFMDKVMIAK